MGTKEHGWAQENHAKLTRAHTGLLPQGLRLHAVTGISLRNLWIDRFRLSDVRVAPRCIVTHPLRESAHIQHVGGFRIAAQAVVEIRNRLVVAAHTEMNEAA